MIIGLCGAPGAGKSEVQLILQGLYGIEPLDDGLIARKHVAEIFGINFADTLSQEGKKKKVLIEGREWTIRELLGEYLRLLENNFDPNIAPKVTLRHAREHGMRDVSLGSVRRNQGVYLRSQGAFIFEITRSATGESGYDFDTYNRACITHVIANNGSKTDLANQVVGLMTEITMSNDKAA